VLEIAPGGPLLAATETVYDQEGAPIDRGEIVYRGDRYRFHTTLVANPASRAMRSLRGG
jgi:DNA-binding GntR family transcriptional regulator